jgi:hypothetical protein
MNRQSASRYAGLALVIVLTLLITRSAYAAWVAQTVDSAGSVGHAPSLAEVSGLPAMSYWDATNQDLKYAQYLGGVTTGNCGPGGNTWQCDTIENTGGGVGHSNSLAVVSGQPAISYLDGANQDLKYSQYLGGATTGNCGPGNNTWQCQTIDSIGMVGHSTSLAEVGGQPAISYWDYANADLKYAHYLGGATTGNCGPGRNTWQCNTVDSAGIVGQFNSLAEVGGLPAISYYDATNQDLKYARYLGGATTGNCGPGGNTWQCDTLDSPGDMGQYNSLAVVGGQPAISYYNGFPGFDLRYARYLGGATTGNCGPGSNTWQCETVDGPGTIGITNSLADVGGLPAISYLDFGTNVDLRYARHLGGATTGNCGPGGNTWQCDTLDSAGNVGSNSSLAAVGGFPAIGYYDSSNQDLRFIQADEPVPTLTATPTEPPVSTPTVTPTPRVTRTPMATRTATSTKRATPTHTGF